MKIFATPEALLDAVGTQLGPTEWLTIRQDRIDQFAAATNDHQWIHVDPEKAAKGAFGACIAHGFLTLALANDFLPKMMRVDGVSMGVNYGCDKIRFPNIVKVNSDIRGTGEIINVAAIKGGIQSTVRVTIEVKGESRPACVVDTISRYYPI